ANGCFPNLGPVRVVAFETDDLENVRRAKTAIRDLYKVENHSTHINDTHTETLRLARIFFNDNSIHFLNVGRPRYFPRFHKHFELYRQMLINDGHEGEHFCVDGSAVMALYGLR